MLLYWGFQSHSFPLFHALLAFGLFPSMPGLLLLSITPTRLGHTCLSGVFLGAGIWYNILCGISKFSVITNVSAWAYSRLVHPQSLTMLPFALWTWVYVNQTLGVHRVFCGDSILIENLHFWPWRLFELQIFATAAAEYYLTCLHRHLSSPSPLSLFLGWFTSTCTVQMAPWMATPNTRCRTSMWVIFLLALHRPQPSSPECPCAGQETRSKLHLPSLLLSLPKYVNCFQVQRLQRPTLETRSLHPVQRVLVCPGCKAGICNIFPGIKIIFSAINNLAFLKAR